MTEADAKGKNRETLSWCMYDWAYSAFATVVMSPVLRDYYSQVAASKLEGHIATAYWGYTTVITLFIAAVLSPVMGAIADYSGMKKRLLMIFAALGIFSTALLYFIKTGDWLLASLFFIFGNIGFTVSEVFYNSMLPYVARPGEMDRVSIKD